MFSSRLLTWSQSLLAPLLIASRCVLGPMGQTSKNTPLIPKSHPPGHLQPQKWAGLAPTCETECVCAVGLNCGPVPFCAPTTLSACASLQASALFLRLRVQVLLCVFPSKAFLDCNTKFHQCLLSNKRKPNIALPASPP